MAEVHFKLRGHESHPNFDAKKYLQLLTPTFEGGVIAGIMFISFNSYNLLTAALCEQGKTQILGFA